MFAPHPLVARHLFVHFLLHVFLLLLGDDRRSSDGSKMIRGNCAAGCGAAGNPVTNSGRTISVICVQRLNNWNKHWV